jgi:hypothetical protein
MSQTTDHLFLSHRQLIIDQVSNTSWRLSNPLNPNAWCPTGTPRHRLGTDAHADHHPIHLIHIVTQYLQEHPCKRLTDAYIRRFNEYHETVTRRWRCRDCNVRDNPRFS